MTDEQQKELENAIGKKPYYDAHTGGETALYYLSEWQSEAINHLFTELNEYKCLMSLHRKIYLKASKHWQNKTGKKHTWPDLTKLMIFLVDELDEKTK